MQKALLISTCHAYGLPLDQAAYVLGTADWETDHTLEPIDERGGDTYFARYDAGTPRGQELGNTEPGDGARYKGRGFVQITGRRNYEKAGRLVGADLIGHPELALDPQIAAKVIVLGMVQGWFTGRKLGDYINAGACDFVSARRIVNGTDRATEISLLAKKYQAELTATEYAGAKAAPMIRPAPIPATRSAVKAALLDSGSRTISAADLQTKVYAVSGTAAAASGIIGTVSNTLAAVPPWGWAVLALAVIVGLYLLTHRIVLARIEDALSGAHTGRDIGLVPTPEPETPAAEPVVDAAPAAPAEPAPAA